MCACLTVGGHCGDVEDGGDGACEACQQQWCGPQTGLHGRPTALHGPPTALYGPPAAFKGICPAFTGLQKSCVGPFRSALLHQSDLYSLTCTRCANE
eukprot:366490-Chlamydomonas_euryale.AAC.45